MFSFTMGSVYRVKSFPTGWQMFRWRRGWNGGAEVAEARVKNFCALGFRLIGKATGQVP
jgi:NOL1/NOP2/fmu family ribosome biogenesis protein